jgi:hypothetical protein
MMHILRPPTAVLGMATTRRTVDIGGSVTKVVKALAPDWQVTNPSAPTPYVRRARPDRL